MALTLAQIGTASGNGSFQAQVKGSLQGAINTAIAEAATVQDHVVRKKFAEKANANTDAFAAAMCAAIAAVLPASVSDLNVVTDAQVNTAMAIVFTPFAFTIILPS